MFAATTLPPQDPVVQEMLVNLGIVERKERASKQFCPWSGTSINGTIGDVSLFKKNIVYVIIKNSTTISNPSSPCYPIHSGNCPLASRKMDLCKFLPSRFRRRLE